MPRTFKKRGRWWIDYRAADGRRHREAVGPGASHALAKEVLAKRLAQSAEQRHFPGRVANAKRFNDIADMFWELHGQRLRSRSWGLMLARLRATFGDRRVGDIGTADIQAYYNGVASRSSNSNANRYLTLIRAIFNRARSWGAFVGENPCSGVKKEREAPHRLRYLTTAEVERLLNACHPRLWPVVAVALLTGMRRGEIMGLCWEHVDMERGCLYLLRTKSGLPRELPVGPRLRGVLERLGPKAGGPVFDLPDIMLRRYFDRALRDAGIASFRFHDLRHTFASHFVMAGGDLLSLSRLLGHTSTQMTTRYAHLAQDYLAAKVAALESRMGVPDPAPQLGLDWQREGRQDQSGVVGEL